MISVTFKNTVITGIVTAVKVEKSLSAAGSHAEVSAICSPGDSFLPSVNPACGDSLSVSWNSQEVFSGTAETVCFSADGLTLSLICLDGASLLAKNEVYGLFSGTPASVAEKACLLAQVSFGTAWDKPGSVSVPSGTALSAYSVIRHAYGGQCVTEWTGGAVNILKPGERKYSAELPKLLSANARHSIEQMVNSAQIIGYSGRTDAQAENKDDAAAFGLRKKILTLSGKKDEALSQAEMALSGIRREAFVKAFGFHPVRCGDRILMSASEFGIDGEWVAASVSHEFSGGFCVTSLGLTKEE